MGEDAVETPAAVPDDSAEIGNKRNQLENTQRHLTRLEKQQSDLQTTDTSNTSQLAELETNLSTARAKHDEVSKSVADLRSRVSDQQEKVKNLNMDFIAAESDLSALRSEKDELEQALLHDKEEVRGLQKRMKEVDDEKGTLKTLLEKLKKEARQQKGMVTIAKKQLSTSENNRDLAQTDLDNHHKTADEEDESMGTGVGAAAGLGALGGAGLGAGAAASFFGSSDNNGSASPFDQAASPHTGVTSPVPHQAAVDLPLPTTPKALSPVATGASSRSNNPFDRLRTQSRGPAPPVPSHSQSQSPAESHLDAERSTSGPDDSTRDEVSSPSLGTGALVGATTAVGLVAGVAVAGVSAVYDAAKDAVTGEEHGEKDQQSEPVNNGDDKIPKGEEDDPFGAGSGQLPSTTASDIDAFGAPDKNDSALTGGNVGADTDPFGAPPRSGFDSFDSGFGDSFAAPSSSKDVSAAAPAGNPDFDSAFDDFDDDDAPKTAEPTSISTGTFGGEQAGDEPISPGIPMGVPKSALPDLRPDPERTDSTQAIAPASAAATPGNVSPVDDPMDNAEPVVSAAHVDDASSDEEDDGPEDLDQPMKPYGSSGRLPELADKPEAVVTPAPAAEVAPVPVAVVSPPVEGSQKGRRSAPPPPASRGSSVPPPLAAPIDDFDPFGAPSTSSPQTAAQSNNDDFDPFGAPSSSSPPPTQASSNAFAALPPGAAAANHTADTTGPRTSKFDDDDFDFSDMPPAQVDTSEQASQPISAPKGNSAFDDEFSGFDDEFESVPTNPNSGSDRSNMSKSYEMVTPTQDGSQQHQQQQQRPSDNMDEWGMGKSADPAPAQTQRPQPTSTFSFDDAFGGDFEPA